MYDCRDQRRELLLGKKRYSRNVKFYTRRMMIRIPQVGDGGTDQSGAGWSGLSLGGQIDLSGIRMVAVVP